MAEEKLIEAFRSWWLSQNESWPERAVSFKLTIGTVGQVEIIQLPNESNPLVREVFALDNSKQFASNKTKNAIGTALSLVRGLFGYRQGPQWESATMDDFFSMIPTLSDLKERPGFGKSTIEVILCILNGTKTNRYEWQDE